MHSSRRRTGGRRDGFPIISDAPVSLQHCAEYWGDERNDDAVLVCDGWWKPEISQVKSVVEVRGFCTSRRLVIED